MSVLPSYGMFFDRPKVPRVSPPRPAVRQAISPPRKPDMTDTDAERVLRVCCIRRELALTTDETSAICRACGTIMPANWVAP